jgi:hypothetical protein
MSTITNLEPLCAMVMLRMSHGQLLHALFAEDAGSAAQTPQDDEDSDEADDDDGPPSCVDSSTCHDFCALTEGQLSSTGVYRLSSHMRDCDSCKYVFATMVDEVRRAKALDTFGEDDDDF